MAVLTDRDTGDETPTLRDLPVVRWRVECLEEAGYPPLLAMRLAKNADVDLHDAVELLSRGCSVGEAERILK